MIKKVIMFAMLLILMTVTINPMYAKIHGQSNLNNKLTVSTKTVSAKQLYTDGNSIHEWRYVI